MHFIPGLRLRVSANDEATGIDDAEMGELAYDYVRLEQETGHSVTGDASTANGEAHELRRHHAPNEAASVCNDSLDTQLAA